MSMYIKNVTKNIDIGIKGRTLKPGCGDVFSDEISEQSGVAVYIKKGWLKAEMVKEVPGGVSAGEVKKDSGERSKKSPEKEVEREAKKAPEKEVKKESEKEAKSSEPNTTTPAK